MPTAAPLSHVLVTADTVGGVWTYTRELVTGLARAGIRVTLVSLGALPAPGQADWVDDLIRRGHALDFRPTAFRLEWMQDSGQDLSASSEFLLRLIDDVRPDILHSSQFCYGALPCAVPRIVVGHSDVISWHIAVHGPDPPDCAWIRQYREVVTRGLENASVVVAPSHWMLQRLARHYIVPAKSRVVYNGREPSLFRPDRAKEEMVVSAGRLWDPGKQMALLCDSPVAIPVHILGPDRDPCLTRTEEQAPAVRQERNSAHLHGLLPEHQVATWLERAAIYAATSRYEPFGLAPLEAALAGCAIVANDIPSFREIWGESVRYFRTNDAASLAEEIGRLWHDPELRARYSGASHKRARNRYTAERMVAGYLALYEECLCAAESFVPAVMEP